MADELLLGLDIGTTNIKAIIFDAGGALVSAASIATPMRRPRPGWAEHEPEELWQAAVAAIRRALASVADPRRVRGLAVASVAEAGVLVNARGEPVGPLIAWFDSRTIPQMQRWREQCDPLDGYRVTGVVPAPIYSVFKLAWLRDNVPDAYATATTWLNVADYIAFRLCGARATDYSLATRMMLLDLRARRWSPVLLASAGIRADLLAELVASGTRIGAVTAAAAAETGLAEGTVVGAGGHDHICGALAAGVRREGECLDSMGTAEAVFLALDRLRIDDDAFAAGMTFGAHVARDRYYALDGLYSSGASIEWLRGLAAPGAPSSEAFGRVEALAASTPLGSLGVLFFPRLAAGERGALLGLTIDAGPAVLARAVYEGLAFEWRRILERIEANLGIHAATIRVIGGGTRSPVWLGIKADSLGRTLHVLDLDESVALGAALLGGLAAGVYRDEDEAMGALRLQGRALTPDAERHARYERIYQHAFVQIASAVAPVHDAVRNIDYE